MQRLAFALLFLGYTQSEKMSLCEYWLKRDIDRPECRPARSSHWSLAPVRVTASKTDPAVLAMPVCSMVSDWSRCQKSDHCPLGLMCWARGSPCCTPQISDVTKFGAAEQCPTTKQMGIQCYAKNPVNWCNSDNDCHKSSVYQKCCPSGCGYNMCIRTSLNVNVKVRMSSLSLVPDQCPSMDSINIFCVSQGVSWCSAHQDCLSNAAQTRYCCPTRCGYNVCLLKVYDRWLIA